MNTTRSLRLCLSAWLCLAAAGVAGERERFSRATHPPTPQTYRKLADQIETHLREGVLKSWFPRCIDREQGGFRPHFLEDWTPGTKQDKTIVFQSRMTWVAAQVALRYPDLADEYRRYAAHGLDCLEKVMWDREQGGPFWGLDAAGRISPAYGTEKHAYGVAFAIYGTSAAYAALKEPRALDLAQRTFLWFDEHAHDAQHGGYFEALSREGKVLLAPPPAAGGPPRTRNQLSTPYGFKTMNSHIHLLEAITALYEVWPDPRVEARLRELLAVVRDKIAVAPGCLNLYFTPDWRAVPDHDSFGHDVETAYLLLEAAAAMKMPDDARTRRVARSLVDHALEWGWDGERGGFFDRGAAFAPAWAREKVWWTQAEGLNALLLMHELYGRNDPRYYDAFLKQWDFLWNYQIDHRHGEWHEQVGHDGAAKAGQAKGTIWKAAYHNGRALMNVSAALRKLAKE